MLKVLIVLQRFIAVYGKFRFHDNIKYQLIFNIINIKFYFNGNFHALKKYSSLVHWGIIHYSYHSVDKSCFENYWRDRACTLTYFPAESLFLKSLYSLPWTLCPPFAYLSIGNGKKPAAGTYCKLEDRRVQKQQQSGPHCVLIFSEPSWTQTPIRK